MKQYTPLKEQIISAGIDIGTSTTKLVISRFSLMNTAGGTHTPRIEIVDKQVLYRSPIFRTPLLSLTEIDVSQVEKLVESEYRMAGITREEVKTGAVIITGETATKRNASEIIHSISKHSGEFLVATAGPDLECIIAAKGSGAFRYSKKYRKVIANIDIGGGTANIAVYKAGVLCGTCTLHIGGRLIEFANGKIQHISDPIKQLIRQEGLTVKEADTYSERTIKKLTDFMANTIASVLAKTHGSKEKDLILGHAPNWNEDVDVIMFSGGVSECIYQFEQTTNTYEDIGVTLAQSLKENDSLKKWQWIMPDETVRATVLGAGTQTTEISGSTIEVDDNELPMRNLPIFQVDFQLNFEMGVKNLSMAVQEAMDIYDSLREGENFGLYLTNIPYLSFRNIQFLGEMIIQLMKLRVTNNQPIVIVVESDYAKALGQTLKTIAPGQSIICIDQIKVENGDYLDIGQILQTNVVPVVVKTLTFNH